MNFDSKQLLADLEQSFAYKPESASWGMFACDDAPGGIGGGSGGFNWFASKSELLDFIEKYPLLASSSDENDLDVELEVRECVKSARKSQSLPPDFLDRVNGALKGIEQILWCGTFVLLCQGTGEFEKRIRGEFDDTQIIKPGSEESFIQFLQDYGH